MPPVKHVRFRDPAGAVRHGRWTDDGIEFGGETFETEAVSVLPPTEPSKLVCVGRNYADHAAEKGFEVPDRPILFLKGPNTLAGHGDVVTLPAGKQTVEWEGELGVVVDEQCRNVAAEDAMDVVAGYTLVDDISNRDDQRQETNWVRGKAFDGAAPVGPVVADPEDVPADARITTQVNGETRQDASLEDMIFDVPSLVEEITRYLTLEPGDVIATGTPDGVGPFADGDTIAISVEGVGTLEHAVRVP
jgi:2-keto-4-pentenoate hydratase/2-oxohepta-3-ene-1,7-dioic acid hydratase in catechol pathway